MRFVRNVLNEAVDQRIEQRLAHSRERESERLAPGIGPDILNEVFVGGPIHCSAWPSHDFVRTVQATGVAVVVASTSARNIPLTYRKARRG